MQSMQDQTILENLTVRTYHTNDQPAVARLYTDGLLAGQIAANDTGADIDNIHEAYFSEDANHFWVAEVDGQVRGMIGCFHEQDGHMGEIRRLRVEKDWQNTNIGARLLEHALEHCKVHKFLKVVLDTQFNAESVVGLFDRFGFQHTRSKSIHGKELLEFYLDLYRQMKDE
ncbi:MAG TPA: hypothetical protein DCM28_23620 [Phycisphaerales bacterium]|nr:hypothetical protein [Phycisphaerales bacterium]HCD35203.1 hypothetical protein [Phycisphaerales bacterium]|tara:strand:+ start:898 stop:1410 length:513 start_codon:yes stop_codon:yes gene_type:complete